MTNRGALAPVLLTVLFAALLALAAGVAVPRPALALTLETPLTNPDGSPNFADDKNSKYDRFRNNLSGQSDDNGGHPGSFTFGSSDSGSFTFSVGPMQRSSDPFHNDRFFRLGPPTNR